MLGWGGVDDRSIGGYHLEPGDRVNGQAIGVVEEAKTACGN